MISSKSLSILPIEYSLQIFHRSNQDTSLLHRPAINEGEWVQTGDLLADCSSSSGGEFSIGRNILIAYLPWEGYNYEDALLINERLVYDDLYTSIHIERYDVSIEKTFYGEEKITKEIPLLKDTKELDHLDENGVALAGTWLKEGDILVGKITPTEQKKTIAPYIQLYNDIMGKKVDYSVQDSSLRMPRGLEAKLIKTRLFKQSHQISKKSVFGIESPNMDYSLVTCFEKTQNEFRHLSNINKYGSDLMKIKSKKNLDFKKRNLRVNLNEKKLNNFSDLINYNNNINNDKLKNKINKTKKNKKLDSLSLNEKIFCVHVFLAEKRKLQIGDKMAGRHGNKGIISEILPRQDMPYLPDGTPIDMALNPLGVPSRMNVGQIYECLLGLAGKYLSEQYRILAFDERYGPEASRSFVFSKLYEAKKKTGQSWLFQPTNPGKLKLFDGRNGVCFDQSITCGYSYMIKLVHLVDDKIHCLTNDHDVLTSEGWVPIDQVSMSHKIASLEKNRNLIYQNPLKVYNYKNFKGELYSINKFNVDLVVTLNHRMFITEFKQNNNFFKNYRLIPAQFLIGKQVQYCKTAYWGKKNFQFFLPSIRINSTKITEKTVKMDSWLKFFAIWISYGLVTTPFEISKNGIIHVKHKYSVEFFQIKKSITQNLKQILQNLGYKYTLIKNRIIIQNKQLCYYLKSLNFFSKKKKLPRWVWELSQKQVRIFLEYVFIKQIKNKKSDLIYNTSSCNLADDFMQLVLHAGWTSQKFTYNNKKSLLLFNRKNFKVNQKENNHTIWRISIMQNETLLNTYNDKQTNKTEFISLYEGRVFCLNMKNEVFYIRRNGIPVWTGNSRSTGPYSLVTQQPLKGRSKHGGQRLGEMEVWALEAYGAAFTLLELLTIKSDDVTGRLTIWDYVLYKRPLYIGTPASFKVLICELESLCLDIGIYKSDNLEILRSINVSNMG